jgi:hypothetical protein
MKTKTITLSKGQQVRVDADDFEYLNQWKWHVSKQGYAVRSEEGGSRKILMHRVVAETPEDMHTDHINRDRLDNRKTNLRACTPAENMQNKSPYTRKKDYAHSRNAGVSWITSMGRWQLRIQINRKRRVYGYYNTKAEALSARELILGDI